MKCCRGLTFGDKMWWLDPRNELGCVSTIVRRRMKKKEEKTIISENLWGSLWNNSLRKKVEREVLGAAAKEKGCTYSWRTYEKLENSRRMLGTWLNKSESWKCRIGRSREGNKNGKEENRVVCKVVEKRRSMEVFKSIWRYEFPSFLGTCILFY